MAQGKGPQVKYICIKGLKIPPLERILRENMDAGKVPFQHPLRIRPQENYASSFLCKFQKVLTSKKCPPPYRIQ
jgi:hypothetical protein